MKNITLIACTAAITFSLSAFTYSSWNDLTTNNKLTCQTTTKIEPPTFFYNLSSPAKNTITKERIHNAKTISDLMPDFGMQENLKNKITSVRDIKIIIEEENVYPTKQSSKNGNGNILSEEQKILLNSIDYSSSFYLEGYSTPNKPIKDLNEARYFNYHMTVVPEQQATYKAGNNQFIDFLSTKCQSTIDKLQKGNLKFGNISFMISKAGTISNININSTCGYPSVDKKMIDLMKNLPDVWNVATNEKGEKVSQILVFSYGQTGC